MPTNSDTTIDWTSQLEQNRPWLTKVLRARIGNRHDVEDVFQELALSVLKQVDRFRAPEIAPPETLQAATEGSHPALRPSVPCDPSKVAPWLYRLAVRQAVNFYRKTNRLTHAKPTADLDDKVDATEPLDWLLAVEHQQQIQQVFAELPPEDREILTLKYTENWNYQQLADKLGTTVRNIEYRLVAARTRLRKCLTRAL